jgi:hypothetical protein
MTVTTCYYCPLRSRTPAHAVNSCYGKPVCVDCANWLAVAPEYVRDNAERLATGRALGDNPSPSDVALAAALHTHAEHLAAAVNDPALIERLDPTLCDWCRPDTLPNRAATINGIPIRLHGDPVCEPCATRFGMPLCDYCQHRTGHPTPALALSTAGDLLTLNDRPICVSCRNVEVGRDPLNAAPVPNDDPECSGRGNCPSCAHAANTLDIVHTQLARLLNRVDRARTRLDTPT